MSSALRFSLEGGGAALAAAAAAAVGNNNNSSSSSNLLLALSQSARHMAVASTASGTPAAGLTTADHAEQPTSAADSSSSTVTITSRQHQGQSTSPSQSVQLPSSPLALLWCEGLLAAGLASGHLALVTQDSRGAWSLNASQLLHSTPATAMVEAAAAAKSPTTGATSNAAAAAAAAAAVAASAGVRIKLSIGEGSLWVLFGDGVLCAVPLSALRARVAAAAASDGSSGDAAATSAALQAQMTCTKLQVRRFSSVATATKTLC